ncbi:hypothetical protein BC829DRAFT_297633 [Chytridium lagenaria]|nr:hypothetical protein BC829DRAFT_297633 [Chytridium lagenaria]
MRAELQRRNQASAALAMLPVSVAGAKKEQRESLVRELEESNSRLDTISNQSFDAQTRYREVSERLRASARSHASSPSSPSSSQQSSPTSLRIDSTPTFDVARKRQRGLRNSASADRIRVDPMGIFGDQQQSPVRSSVHSLWETSPKASVSPRLGRRKYFSMQHLATKENSAGLSFENDAMAETNKTSGAPPPSLAKLFRGHFTISAAGPSVGTGLSRTSTGSGERVVTPPRGPAVELVESPTGGSPTSPRGINWLKGGKKQGSRGRAPSVAPRGGGGSPFRDTRRDEEREDREERMEDNEEEEVVVGRTRPRPPRKDVEQVFEQTPRDAVADLKREEGINMGRFSLGSSSFVSSSASVWDAVEPVTAMSASTSTVSVCGDAAGSDRDDLPSINSIPDQISTNELVSKLQALLDARNAKVVDMEMRVRELEEQVSRREPDDRVTPFTPPHVLRRLETGRVGGDGMRGRGAFLSFSSLPSTASSDGGSPRRHEEEDIEPASPGSPTDEGPKMVASPTGNGPLSPHRKTTSSPRTRESQEDDFEFPAATPLSRQVHLLATRLKEKEREVVNVEEKRKITEQLLVACRVRCGEAERRAGCLRSRWRL